MPKQISCSLHGKQDLARVCVHITDAPGKVIGFWWYHDPEVGHEAHCDGCEKLSIELSEEAWRDMRKSTRDMCLACYRKAAEANGVEPD